MDITVKVSYHNDWQKHSYEPGKPDIVDIPHARDLNALHIVLSPDIKALLTGARNEEELLSMVEDIRGQVDETLQFVEWAKVE